ncbi:uncharacterized protein TNCV_1781691 [Trichonephila clavipes]|nr:uncharacterized protein TNCV_1781691 [Trichonephila clavipes]
MIVQFRNEKVSNHGSIPITIDCNVVAFIVFEEGFHQPIKRPKQSVFLDVTVFRHTLVWISFTPNAPVLFVDVAIQPEKSTTKTFQILTEAYGDETLSRAYAFEWHKRISWERDSVEDERAGCPRGKKPELGSDRWLLHQDNAPTPSALSVKQFMTSKNILIGHPPYLPELSPHATFSNFSTGKSFLKETHFTSVEEVQVKTENLLKGLPKTSLQNCYQQ